MDTLSYSAWTPKKQNSQNLYPGPLDLRILGYSLSLAEDIHALEECLSLERIAGGPRESASPAGIFSPPAVPFCEFLMLRNGFGKLLAVTRLMCLGGNNRVLSPLESGRFHLSPLLTALRYSREGVVEMGSPAFLPDTDQAQSAKLIWNGLIHFMERKKLGFVVGSEVLPKMVHDSQSIPKLMDAYGLHPDLEVEVLSKFRKLNVQPLSNRFHAEIGANACKISTGLHEALRRGCRLAAEPVLDQATGDWEFIWVSFREMLGDGRVG